MVNALTTQPKEPEFGSASPMYMADGCGSPSVIPISEGEETPAPAGWLVTSHSGAFWIDSDPALLNKEGSN